jgi:transposase
MKIGGCWRSVRTAARYCLVRSYLATARNYGIHPLDAIRDALTGNPWVPPQPA